MKTIRYTLMALCVLTLFTCKHKSKTFRDAIKNESENHTDTTNVTSATVADDRLIIPGKSIGDITLDESTSGTVHQKGESIKNAYMAFFGEVK